MMWYGREQSKNPGGWIRGVMVEGQKGSMVKTASRWRWLSLVCPPLACGCGPRLEAIE